MAKRHHVELVMDDSVYQRLETLRQEAGAKNFTELARWSFAVYELLHKRMLAGDRICTLTIDNKMTDVRLHPKE